MLKSSKKLKGLNMHKILSVLLAFFILISSFVVRKQEISANDGYTKLPALAVQDLAKFQQSLKSLSQKQLKELTSDMIAISKININLQSDADLRTFQNQIKSLNTRQLNELIAILNVQRKAKTYVNESPILKGIWLAAAQAARAAGYPLSATLVEHSVWGTNYFEHNGIFAAKIKTNSLFKSMLSRVHGSDAFLASEDKDLFYSLHRFEFHIYASRNRVLTITDTFDFDPNAKFGSWFANFVNSWGAIAEDLKALTPISIRIVIDV